MKHFIESIFASREFYYDMLTPICHENDITHTDLIVLLCLANEPEHDTATDVVERLKFTKSAVSMSIKSLQDKGLVTGEYLNGNHRTIHLTVCETAMPIVEAGKKAQEIFYGVLTEGFSDGDKERFKRSFERVTENIKAYHNRY